MLMLLLHLLLLQIRAGVGFMTGGASEAGGPKIGIRCVGHRVEVWERTWFAPGFVIPWHGSGIEILGQVGIGRYLTRLRFLSPRHGRQSELVVEFEGHGEERDLLGRAGIGKVLFRVGFVIPRCGREIELLAEVDIGKVLVRVGLVIPRHRWEIELLVEFERCGEDRELLGRAKIGLGLNRLWFVIHRRGK